MRSLLICGALAAALPAAANADARSTLLFRGCLDGPSDCYRITVEMAEDPDNGLWVGRYEALIPPSKPWIGGLAIGTDEWVYFESFFEPLPGRPQRIAGTILGTGPGGETPLPHGTVPEWIDLGLSSGQQLRLTPTGGDPITTTPEPGTLLLVGSGLVGLAARRRAKRH